MAKKRAAKKRATGLSPAQLELMQIVWERGEVTVSDVWKELSQSRTIARNTVQTMMVRMEDKGWLAHRPSGQTFIYSAAAPRKRKLSKTVWEMVDSLFAGSAEDLVSALLSERGLSKQQADRLREAIDAAEERTEEDGPHESP